MPKAKRIRILSVTLIREADYDADTSYLGEYAAQVKSPYSIDRRHSRECVAQNGNPQTAEARAYFQRVLERIEKPLTSFNSDAEEDARVLIEDLLDSVEECTCGGQFVERNSYEYFEPRHGNYEGCSEKEIRDYCWQDFERMEDFERRKWQHIGVRAEAQIGIPQGGQSYLTQKLTSGGLWGIESDSEESYIKEEEDSQLGELREVLASMGFSKRAIATAFKNVEHKEQ